MEREKPPEVVLDCAKAGVSGKARLIARLPDGTTYTDVVDIGLSAQRAAYCQRLTERYPGLAREPLDAELERIAAEMLSVPGSGGGRENRSQATCLVELVEADSGVELFHTPGGHDSEGYARVTFDDHSETWALTSRGFRRWLSRKFFQEKRKVPGGQALADALTVLAGMAIHEGQEHEVHVRVAELNGVIWLDLADADWRAVEISRSGWRIVAGTTIPVRFIRRRGALALPAPVPGGELSLLRAIVNLPTDDIWIPTVAWLVAALRPGRPFPILNVNGEQGSAKSTLSKMLRSLIDPAKPLLRRPPKDARDLMIAASNSWVVGYDNISHIPADLSDSLCSLATGGGFSTRELYSDDDEKLFDSIRPILINGIDDAVIRSDLVDRSLPIQLPVIPPERRRDEDELWEQFYRDQPLILGALLDAVSAGLANFPETRLERLPRMAAFARWIVAAERALPWAPGQFMLVYEGNIEQANMLALEASAVALPIMALVETRRRWRGTFSELLAELEANHTDDKTRKRKEWPNNRKAMGNAVRRIAPNLRAIGISVDLPQKGTGKKKQRIVMLERTAEPRPARSAPPADPVRKAPSGVSPDPRAGRATATADCPPSGRSAADGCEDGVPTAAGSVADCADHADRPSPECSGVDDWGVL